MLAKLLDKVFSSCSSDTKFVLIAFWDRYGVKATVPCTLKQMAEELGLPYQAVSKSVAQLLDLDALRASPQSEGRGRPKCIYELSEALQMELQRGRVRTMTHRNLVERLLGGEGVRAVGAGFRGEKPRASKSSTRLVAEKREAPVRAGNLSLANRLLLAVLLSRSDAFGIVRGVGNKELCLLTGMNEKALKQRLQRLTELGFIRRHIPGLASPLFTEKLKSIYWLNLNHLQLSPSQDVVSAVLHKNTIEPHLEYKFLAGVRFDRDFALNGGGGLSPSSVLRLFRQAPGHAFDQLEFFICECVQGFLSRCWVATDSVAWRKVRCVDSIVRGQVKAFFRQPILDPKSKAGLNHDEIYCFIEELILSLAREVVQRFSAEIDFAGASYTLVPAHTSIGHRCMALLFIRSQIGHRVMINTGSKTGLEEFAREADLPLDLREQSGLLTP